MLDQLDCFLSKGYCHFSGLDLIDLSKFNILNVEVLEDPDLGVFTNSEHEMILNFVNTVSTLYVTPVYPLHQIKYYAVWDGVDIGSTTWHNDNVEGFDFNCLFYYDSTTPHTGGQIEFQGPLGEICIFPKAGDLVFINQDTKFKHRASRSIQPRRVASIEFKIL
jgi:hypothetical protein